ncbi:PucR family transcriptional regulator [Jatrophihabitans sp.]|uniref:PucR family transcriptional regulator n=1 Tax=Jatrophihabitans sp. TaxID=1932789 RepID=UPI002EE91F5F
MHGTLTEETINRIEQSSGALATRSLARMDEQLAWFRRLPADQRSWVTLVAQAGIASFVEWLRSPHQVVRLTGEVFSIAPRELTRRVSLQHTVELVRQTIAVVEEAVPSLAGPGEEQEVADAMLRFSREIAFAAARAYAGAAETRGRWDARLEALVIDGLVRGVGPNEEGSPVSQLAALGWRAEGAVTTVVGGARNDLDPTQALDSVHRTARRAGFDVLAGVHGGRLVVILGGITDPIEAAKAMLEEFDDAPVVVGGSAPRIDGAAEVTAAALSGLRAVAGWPGAPRPISAEDLLPERTIAGDLGAQRELIETVYQPLVEAGNVLLETVVSYLDGGRALETTARALFVHTNTVRYRLRRAAELCGHAPTDARGAFTIQLALVLGRLNAPGSGRPASLATGQPTGG